MKWLLTFKGFAPVAKIFIQKLNRITMDTTMLAKKILQITRHGYYEEQVEKIAQLLNSITSASNGAKPIVSGSLPMYDVDELNEIVKLYNNGEIDLYTCIGRVWNKAYFIGANEGMKAGSLGR